MEKHLCIVMDRYTRKQISVDMVIEAQDWYDARQIAAAQFRKVNPSETRIWEVDSIPLDNG